MLTSSILWGVGDVVAQAFLGPGERDSLREQNSSTSSKSENKFVFTLNIPRTLGFMLYGIFNGPFLHASFSCLIRIFGNKSTYANLINAFAYEGFLWPLFACPTFYFCTDLTKGYTYEEIYRHIMDQWSFAAFSNIVYWVPITFCCFHFISPAYLVVVNTSFCIVWNIFFCWMANSTYNLQKMKEAYFQKVK